MLTSCRHSTFWITETYTCSPQKELELGQVHACRSGWLLHNRWHRPVLRTTSRQTLRFTAVLGLFLSLLPLQPWKRRQKQTFQAPDLSSAQSPACSPGNALRCSSAVGLYLYPDNLLSIMKSLFWQGMHLSLNQNHSGNGTETRASKLATVLRGALLAGCLGGWFEIMHGDGQRGTISKVVIIMPLSGRDLETALGAQEATGREAARSLPTPGGAGSSSTPSTL